MPKPAPGCDNGAKPGQNVTGGMGTPLHHWDDTGWLKRESHLSPADSFLVKEPVPMQVSVVFLFAVISILF